MAQSTTAVPLVSGGLPTAQIVLGESASDSDCFAAGELQSYIEKLAKVRLDIVKPAEALAAGEEAMVLVGQPENNALARNALDGVHDTAQLDEEGFVIHTGELQGRPTVALAGRTDIGTLYAVYALVEMLGATFVLSKDILPPPVDDLSVPATSRVWEPAFSRRGLQPFANDLQDVTWGEAYYKMLIDQMVKLRMNYLEFFVQAYQPWVDYTFRGEKPLLGDKSEPDSGYLVISRSVPSCSVDEVKIGKEHFAGLRTMAPPEMQDVDTPEEAVRRFKRMIKAIIRYAKSKGMKVGFSTDPTYAPANHARFARNYAHRPHTSFGYSAHLSPTDPVGLEYGKTWLRALLETYPEIDDLFLYVSEAYELDPHPDAKALYERMRPQYAPALKALKDAWVSLTYRHTSFTYKGLSPEDLIDIQIGWIHRIRELVDAAKKMADHTRICMAFFFKGYLLPTADNLIEREIPFMDMQSSGVFPVEGDINASYFTNMGDRDRYINCRIDDDASMFGLPFYLRQFQHDGLFKEAREAGVSGYAGQIFRSRGTEHHSRYLAHGAWEPDLTPEAFYERYSRDIFGDAAASAMQKAFNLLEEMDEQTGWNGVGNFSFSGGCRELNRIAPILLDQENPFDGPPDAQSIVDEVKDREGQFTAANEILRQALAVLEGAQTLVSTKGAYELEYLISKTKAYISHLEMVILIDQGLAAYCQAFIDHTKQEPALGRALRVAESYLVAAAEKARETTRQVAEIIDDPTDLGILFLANVWDVGKTDELLDLVRRVVNFHHGRPYWKEGVDSKSRYGIVDLTGRA